MRSAFSIHRASEPSKHLRQRYNVHALHSALLVFTMKPGVYRSDTVSSLYIAGAARSSLLTMLVLLHVFYSLQFVYQQDWCNSNQPLAQILGVMTGPAHYLFTFSELVPDTDSGSLLQLPHHFRIGHFRTFIKPTLVIVSCLLPKYLHKNMIFFQKLINLER